MAHLGDRPDVSTHQIYCEGPMTSDWSEVATAAEPGQEVARRVTILAPRTARAWRAARGRDEEESGVDYVFA